MYPPDLVPILPQPPPLLHYEPLSPTPVLGTQLIEVSPTHHVLSWQAPVEHSYKLSTQASQIGTNIISRNHSSSFPLNKRSSSLNIPQKCFVAPMKKQKVSDTTFNTTMSNANIGQHLLHNNHHEVSTNTVVQPLAIKSPHMFSEELKKSNVLQPYPSEARKLKDCSSQDLFKPTDVSRSTSKCLIPPQKRKALLEHYKKVLNESQSCIIVKNPKFSHISTMVQYEVENNTPQMDLESDTESENGCASHKSSKVELDSTTGELNLKAITQCVSESQPNSEPKAKADVIVNTECRPAWVTESDTPKQQENSQPVLEQSVILQVRPIFIQLRNELTQLYTLYYECVHNLELLQACNKEEMFPNELMIGLPLLAQHKHLTNLEQTWEKIQFESSMKFQFALIQHYLVLTDHFRLQIEEKKMAIVKLASDSNTSRDILKEHERIWSENVKNLEKLLSEKKRIRQVKLEGFRQEKQRRQKQVENK